MTEPSILVAGDLAIDWLIDAVEPVHPVNPTTPNWQTGHGVRLTGLGGGALLLARFVNAATGEEIVAPPSLTHSYPGEAGRLHSFAEISSGSTSDKMCRITSFRGYSGSPAAAPAPAIAAAHPLQLVVLDDGGNGFRFEEEAWRGLGAAAISNKSRIVLKTYFPLATGGLWEMLSRPELRERLIVIVTAEDLRRSGVSIGAHLSWEKAAEDLLRHLPAKGELAPLVTGAHLIVRFGLEGAIHHRGDSGPTLLHFDPEHGEGDFAAAHPGQMMGLGSAFTAALAARLHRVGTNEVVGPEVFADGIKAGLLAARRLHATGFEFGTGKPDYPIAKLFTAITKDDPALSEVTLPKTWLTSPAERTWSILQEFDGPGAEVIAHDIVIRGAKQALARFPILRLGRLETAERKEIESYRAIGNLISEYIKNDKPIRPLSIGVFGPPGSGKSTGVKELAVAAAKGTQSGLEILEFNLSQFRSLEDLHAAFHQVRDHMLEAKLPLVFFDEFDSAFGTSLGWLKHFLAPMQDGKFRENGIEHPIVRAIFVFAGGTTSSYREFAGPPPASRAADTMSESDKERADALAAAKQPDFISRLRGYVDIISIDPIQSDDKLYVIRRALTLRSMLARRSKTLFENGNVEGKCNIDDDVLRAFLRVPSYHHGRRSMEALLDMCALTGRDHFGFAELPSREQLDLHVSSEQFLRPDNREPRDEALVGLLAPLVHERYRDMRRRLFPNENHKTDASMRAWNELAPHLQESNRRFVDDIPRKLRMVGCYIGDGSVEGKIPTELSEDEIWKLARIEHERFNGERLAGHWQLGDRDPHGKRSPYLRGWTELKPEIQEYDIDAVRGIPCHLKAAGRAIYRVRPPD